MGRSKLSAIYLGILLFIFGFIVLHAPFTVLVGSIYPDLAEYVKSWKEVLMIFAAICGSILITQRKAWSLFTRERLLWLMIGYGVLHILMCFIIQQSTWATLAGFAIDLRYIVFFLLVYAAVRLYPSIRDLFVRVGVAGAGIVAAFATVQLFLPKDILKYLGYGHTTIEPYMTVDRNHDYIRMNSTLRGPNPLGAYAAMALSITLSYMALQYKKVTGIVKRWAIFGLTTCLLIALWVSYSRSALIGAGLAMAVIVLHIWGRKLKLRWLIVIGIAIIAIAATTLVVGKDNSFISNVLFHENPTEVNKTDSNDGHIASLQSGIETMITHPLGGGVGSTGTASYHGATPFVIENQYLFIAHEVGWLGILLFLAIFFLVMRSLWQCRKDWLGLGVFASGVCLAFVGLLLPVWADDTVSILWWGLAAVVIGGHHGHTINEKTA